MLTLEDFREDCRALTLEAFCLRHGDAFLLHNGPLDRLQVPQSMGATLAIESPGTVPDRQVLPQADFLVFPIMKPQPDGSRPGVAWVGRSEFNEVIVPDATISEVQAFIRREDDGEFYIQDTGSRNGTFVNDGRVPAQGLGDPVLLSSGARIRMGNVKLTFLGAEPFCSLVNRLLG